MSHKFITKVLHGNPEIMFHGFDKSISLGTEQMEYTEMEFKDIAAFDYFINWLEACKYKMIRVDYENAPDYLQEELQEYFDKRDTDEWHEKAMDFYSQHDPDDVDFFVEKAWEMYLEGD